LPLPNNRRLFREEAFARRGNTESLNGLLRVTAPHEWVILVGLFVALLGLAGWGFFSKIEENVQAQCALTYPGDRYTVIAEAPGNVIELLVDVGDRVEAGQAMARLRALDLSRDIAVARARVDILESKAAKMTEAIDEARAELMALEAQQEAGEYITTPYSGVVTAYDLTLGQALEAGATVASVHADAGDTLEAVAMIRPESAARLAVGMEAYILTTRQDRDGAEPLVAAVSHISTGPVAPPHWLTALDLRSTDPSYMVRLDLRDAPSTSLRDGDPCNLRVVVNRVPPIRLLLPLE
jgi:biotin carboxyl carrier protein